MPKKSVAQLDREIAEVILQEAWIVARDAARNNPTPTNREVAKAAWAALVAASPQQRRMGTFASRAGQRQAAERRALTAKTGVIGSGGFRRTLLEWNIYWTGQDDAACEEELGSFSRH